MKRECGFQMEDQIISVTSSFGVSTVLLSKAIQMKLW